MESEFLEKLHFDHPRTAARALMLVGLFDQLIFKHKLLPDHLIEAGFDLRQLLPAGQTILYRTERLNRFVRPLSGKLGYSPDRDILDNWLAHWSALVPHGIRLQVDDTKDKSVLVPADDLIELLSANVPEILSIAKVVRPKTSCSAAEELSVRTPNDLPPGESKTDPREDKAQTLLIVTSHDDILNPVLSVQAKPPSIPAIAAIFLIDASTQSGVTGLMLEAAMDKLELGFAAAVHLPSWRDVEEWRYALSNRTIRSQDLAQFVLDRHGVTNRYAQIEQLARREPYIYLQQSFIGMDVIVDPRKHINDQAGRFFEDIGLPSLSARGIDTAWQYLREQDPVLAEMQRRYLQVKFFSQPGTEPLRKLYAGTTYVLDIFIGPLIDREVRLPAFPDYLLDFADGAVEIDISLTPLYLTPDVPYAIGQSGTITLPQRGRSGSCQFNLTTPPALRAFRARIVVSHRSAVLQTLIVAIEPIAGDERMGLPFRVVTESQLQRVDTLARQDHARFDLTMVLNDNFNDKPGATVTTPSGTFFTEPPGWHEFCKNTQDLLSELTLAEVDFGSAVDVTFLALVRRLAIAGAWALKRLQKQAPQFDSQAAQYIQVVEAVNGASVPVELFYEGEAPSLDAPLCDYFVSVGTTADCRASCPHIDRDAVLCPMAFWGMHKHIERHKNVSGETRAELVVPANRSVRRFALGKPMLAASRRVAIADYENLNRSLRANFSNVIAAHSWQEWIDSVRTQRPGLHVILPHADSHPDAPEQLALEIHDSWLMHAQVEEKYLRTVTQSSPVVLLIGCETGQSTTHQCMNFASEFYACGARLVIATVSAVLGRHAAALAAKVGADLVARSISPPNDFGAILLANKRRLFIEGNVLGLALVVYGDASWELGYD